MPTRDEDVNALIGRFDAATTEVAKDLQELRDKLAAEGVSADSLAKFDASVARLEALGADPSNPIPPA